MHLKKDHRYRETSLRPPVSVPVQRGLWEFQFELQLFALLTFLPPRQLYFDRHLSTLQRYRK